MDEENIFGISDEETVDIPTTEETEDTQREPEADVEQTSKTDAEGQKEPEDEGKKVLEYLNKKGIKYNGENVELKSLDDVVNNIQKGMNYDKLKNKTDSEENVVMKYVSEMASKMNLTPEQYIQKVKDYERQKEKETQEEEIQQLMADGVGEESAKRLVKVEALADQLERERAELQKQREEIAKKADEDKEYEDFLKEYPDIDASKIPDEVYKDAKEVGLLNAYRKYENKVLKEKINQMELNKKNSSSSVVTNTTENGSTGQQSEDDFVKALFYKEE